MFNGIKTTEFWVSATVVLGSILTQVSSLNVLPPKYAGLAASIAAAGYAVSRGIKKTGPNGGL